MSKKIDWEEVKKKCRKEWDSIEKQITGKAIGKALEYLIKKYEKKEITLAELVAHAGNVGYHMGYTAAVNELTTVIPLHNLLTELKKIKED